MMAFSAFATRVRKGLTGVNGKARSTRGAGKPARARFPGTYWATVIGDAQAIRPYLFRR
jgi:hypothetical protein